MRQKPIQRYENKSPRGQSSLGLFSFSNGKDVPFEKRLKQDFFSRFTYNLHDRMPHEQYYHLLFHTLFVLLGMEIEAEVATNIGRMDNVIETDDQVFIFEHKHGTSAQKALEQIKTKGYADRYKRSQKRINLIGLEFGDNSVKEIVWGTVQQKNQYES